MTLSTGPNIGLLDNGEPGEGHYLELMRQWRWLDFLLQPVVKSRVATLPTSGQIDGDAYILTAAGANQNKVVRWSTRLATPAWEYLTPKAGWQVLVADELDGSGLPKPYCHSGTAWVVVATGGSSGSTVQCIPVACSDESTALAVGTAKVTFRMPFGFTLSAVRASLTTAQTSGALLTVNIKATGTTILSTKLIFDNTEKTTTTAATAPVISDADLADDAEITIDIDQIGDGTAKGLKVYLIGVKA